MRTRQTIKCTECYRDVPESDHDVARMTRDGMTCESCYGKLKARGGVPRLPKHLRGVREAGLSGDSEARRRGQGWI